MTDKPYSSGRAPMNREALQDASPPGRGHLRSLVEDLRAEGIEPPPAAAHAEKLLNEVQQRVTRPASLAERLPANPLDVTAADAVRAIRELTADQQLADNDRGALIQLEASVTRAGIAAVAGDRARILAELQVRYAGPADVIRQAIDAGIRPGHTPADVITSDAAVAAWRQLDAAVTKLDHANGVRCRLLHLIGRDVTADDLASGRDAWLRRALDGQLEPRDSAPVSPGHRRWRHLAVTPASASETTPSSPAPENPASAAHDPRHSRLSLSPGPEKVPHWGLR